MRKEVVFAIIIGLILGGIILYGFQVANQSTKNAAVTTTSNQPITLTISPNVSITPTPPLKLSISEPPDHAVVNTNTIKITGKTLANRPVAIENSEDDLLLTSDSDGNFSGNLKLTGGENIIKITVLLADEKTETSQLTVIYTTAKLD